MKKDELIKLYESLKKEHENHKLESFGIKLPKLYGYDKQFTKDALTLVYLYSKFKKKITKEELTIFIKSFYPNVNDVQQARHLGMQKGWYILSGTRGNDSNYVKNGEYMLKSVSEPYPDYVANRRSNEVKSESWNDIKKSYSNRCVTCGSKEGEKHLINKSTITKLQKGHMDPTKPLSNNNIIPQCDWCNRAYKSYFHFDNKGRIIKVNDPNFILKSTKDVQLKIYKLLLKKIKMF
jgi:hypothetical protein